MKKLIATTILILLTCVLWVMSKPLSYVEETYYSKSVLDMSLPLNVNIDIDLVKSLDPAYE